VIGAQMADGDRTERETVASTAAALAPAVPRRLEEWRCPKCRTFLGAEAIEAGEIRVTCKRCGTVNILKVIVRPSE